MRRVLGLLALSFVLAAPASADPVTVGATVVQRDAAATCRSAGGPCQPEADVSGWSRTWAHRALGFQYDLAAGLPFRDAPWVGTHNSFNSIAEMGPTLSDADSNQQLSLTDQLTLDVRSLELDLHTFAGRQVVCHARGEDEGHAGCSIERGIADVTGEIGAWLRAHRDQVLLLYLEDHLGDEGAHDSAVTQLGQGLGDVVYRPTGPGCTPLPLTLTRRAVLAAGKQVVIVSGCGAGAAWPGLAFDWSARHVENGSAAAFRDYPDCGPDHTRAVYDATLVRYYEDSTWLSSTVDGGEPGGMTPAVTAAMARCGVELTGFDQLLAGDGRLDALVWSWARDQPRAGAGDCAVMRADGRWEARSCATRSALACRDASTGAWTVASSSCPSGTRRATPRTGYENSRLHDAAAGRTVALSLRRTKKGGWRAG